MIDRSRAASCHCIWLLLTLSCASPLDGDAESVDCLHEQLLGVVGPRGGGSSRGEAQVPAQRRAWLGASFAKVQEHWADKEYEKPSDQAVKNASGWQFIKLIKNPAEGGSTDALVRSRQTVREIDLASVLR